MTYGEMNNYITHVSDNDLAALCKSVYEFKNGNGVLEPTSTLKILAENPTSCHYCPKKTQYCL